MTYLILFLLLLYLPYAVQQVCKEMPVPKDHPTVQYLISPELAVAGKPLNITCIARRSATLTAPVQNVFAITLFFQNRPVKSCGGDFDKDAAASLSCSLIVANASVNGNSGTYICRTRAGQMCTISRKVIIVKDPIAPSITEAPKSQTNLTIGQELTMTCVAYGIPPPDIVWTKDNILVTLPVNTTKYQGNSTSVVRVTAVDIAQFGVYQCQANNSEGEAQSSPANIAGSIPPVASMVREPPDDVTVSGTEVNIRCIASPPKQYPTSLWSLRDLSVRKIEIVKSGKRLRTCGFPAVNGTVTQEKSCLVALSHTTVNDTGVYTCVASNLIGSVNVTLGVTVKGTPKIANPSAKQVSDNSALIIGVGLAGFVVFCVGR